MQRPIKVALIGGYARSGSTFLGQMLGQLPGCIFVGELMYIWRKHWQKDMLCGCGAPFSDCPFWGAVVKKVVEDLPSGLQPDHPVRPTQRQVGLMDGAQDAQAILTTSTHQQLEHLR
jgi:hypothetical protein